MFFKTAILRKLFDIRFSYKHCNFSHVCLLVKMASKTVTRSNIMFINFSLGKQPFLLVLQFASEDVSLRGTSATQRQKFHTDDINQCLHNNSHGDPNANMFNFTFPLVDFGKVLCSSTNELQPNSPEGGGGGYFRNFWVGMCCWDPGTFNPYQS